VHLSYQVPAYARQIVPERGVVIVTWPLQLWLIGL